MGINKRYAKSYKYGRDAESRFKELAEKQGWLIRKASEDEDMYDHIDLFMAKPISVDVKSTKKIFTDKDDNYHWVEILNVKGKLGWLYGKADVIAFETIKYWIFVSRLKLVEFIEKNISKEFVTNKGDALYRLYRRKGRKDAVTLIKSMELMMLSDYVSEKALKS